MLTTPLVTDNTDGGAFMDLSLTIEAREELTRDGKARGKKAYANPLRGVVPLLKKASQHAADHHWN